MKQIVFIQREKSFLPETTLELCSRHTPLVEVLENRGVLLDLSGCGPVEDIIDMIGRQAYAGNGQPLKVGLAACRLLALCAVQISGIPVPESCFYRVKKEYGQLLRVLPGREQQFLASFPLEKFPPLKKEEIRKLKRAAFATIGEIAGVPPSRLFPLLGKRACLVAERSCGIDPTPVLGTYPPLRLIYPFEIDIEKLNWQAVEEQFKSAAQQLAQVMEKRGSGCSRICLELEIESGPQKIERLLTTPCFEAETLFNILRTLLARTGPVRGILQGRIVLAEIALLQWCEQDLFFLAAGEQDKERGKNRVYKILENMENRFPGMIATGAVVDRREQVLAFFDPWRYLQKGI